MIEIYCLLLFAILIVVTILTQQLSSMFAFGLKPILGSRENLKFTGLTGRLERAILNSVISMSLFAPSVLVLAISDISTNQTVIASQIFVFARTIYVVSYGFNIILLRSAGWIVSLLCILTLYYNALILALS